MTWQLDRPQPKLPDSYLWTWDHSTNFVLDDPGLQIDGCYNDYTKQPETYLEDYRRLTDLCRGLGIPGIVIWGFLRESHGGVEFAKKVAAYGAQNNVAIMPGIGTTYYGGVYYQGDHPYSIETFLKKNPDAHMLNTDGSPRTTGGRFHGACAAHPAFRDWMAEGVRWLYREFDIGGCNLENGDFLIDHHPLMLELRKNWPHDDIDVFFNQAVGYDIALRAIEDRIDDTLSTYATYTGFVPKPVADNKFSDASERMGCERPSMVDTLPQNAICQWTITGMVNRSPLPLSMYLEDGEPALLRGSEFWPDDLRPPSRRSVGFLHQPSQWWGGHTNLGRYQQMISTIKESCLRSYRAGMTGVVIHGEVTQRYVPWALNYLAFSHFIHWPTDTMMDFARKTLAPVIGSDDEAVDYVRLLCHLDSGTYSNDDRKISTDRVKAHRKQVANGSVADVEPLRMWHWMDQLGHHRHEMQTVNFF